MHLIFEFYFLGKERNVGRKKKCPHLKSFLTVDKYNSLSQDVLRSVDAEKLIKEKTKSGSAYN